MIEAVAWLCVRLKLCLTLLSSPLKMLLALHWGTLEREGISMIEAPGFSLLHCVTALHKYQLSLLWSGVLSICLPLSDTGE